MTFLKEKNINSLKIYNLFKVWYFIFFSPGNTTVKSVSVLDNTPFHCLFIQIKKKLYNLVEGNSSYLCICEY